MTSPNLPVDLDSTYADDGADATVKLHQQYHDIIHALVNQFATPASAPPDALDILVHSGTVFVPVTGESKHIPLTTFELTPGGNYTFVPADAGKLKGSLTTDTGDVTFTLPANATVAYPLGTTMKALQRGTGQITTVGAAGVTLVAVGAAYKSAGVGGTLLYTKLFTDTWLVEGGTA